MNLKNINQPEILTDILEEITVAEKVVLSKYKKVFLIILIILLMLINLFLAYQAEYRSPEGIANKKREMVGAYGAIFFALPVSAFILSFLISLIPYKRIKYSKKYYPFALIILLVLQVLLFILLIIPRIF